MTFYIVNYKLKQPLYSVARSSLEIGVQLNGCQLFCQFSGVLLEARKYCTPDPTWIKAAWRLGGRGGFCGVATCCSIISRARVPSSDEIMAGGGGAPKVQTAAVSPPLNMADPEATINPTEAIYVRGAEKSYGVGKRRSMVLRGLDMNVKKGVM